MIDKSRNIPWMIYLTISSPNMASSNMNKISSRPTMKVVQTLTLSKFACSNFSTFWTSHRSRILVLNVCHIPLKNDLARVGALSGLIFEFSAYSMSYWFLSLKLWFLIAKHGSKDSLAWFRPFDSITLLPFPDAEYFEVVSAFLVWQTFSSIFRLISSISNSCSLSFEDLRKPKFGRI